MSIEEAVEQLKDLILDRESFIDENTDKDNVFVKDKEALEEAIKYINNNSQSEMKLKSYEKNNRKLQSKCSKLENENKKLQEALLNMCLKQKQLMEGTDERRG